MTATGSSPGGGAVQEARTRAVVVGPLPGRSAVEAFTTMRGELGAPHRSGLLALPGRSDAADELPRTVAVLTELHCDLQPHGWRLQRHGSQDSRAAQSLLAGDINALADVIGAESGGDREPVTTELLGPITLAARLHLHGGERVLRDHGARRDLADSLADGIAGHLRAVREAAGGREVAVRWSEPELQRVLDGRIPTASGYRTLRAVPWAEVRETLTRIGRAAAEAGAASVELRIPQGAEIARFASVGADRLVLDAPGPSAREWEPLAAVREDGVELTLQLGRLGDPRSGRFSTGQHVEAVAGPWTDLGLPQRELSRLMIAAGPGLEDTDPGSLAMTLGRAADIARELEETAREA
ncbi:hypothetical protein [Kocuria palustris]|uniref:hypothetical protein n=1 Tax=Kocuria palustris TaxID=71999 RepID=UPI0011A5D186|nr:hypothetical protein [Kocuria palustris]